MTHLKTKVFLILAFSLILTGCNDWDNDYYVADGYTTVVLGGTRIKYYDIISCASDNVRITNDNGIPNIYIPSKGGKYVFQISPHATYTTTVNTNGSDEIFGPYSLPSNIEFVPESARAIDESDSKLYVCTPPDINGMWIFSYNKPLATPFGTFTKGTDSFTLDISKYKKVTGRDFKITFQLCRDLDYSLQNGHGDFGAMVIQVHQRD